MIVRNNRHPRGLDLGPHRPPVSIASMALSPMPMAGGWKAASERGYRARQLLREQRPPRSRAKVRPLRLDPCQSCGRPLSTLNVRAAYCGQRCRHAGMETEEQMTLLLPSPIAGMAYDNDEEGEPVTIIAIEPEKGAVLVVNADGDLRAAATDAIVFVALAPTHTGTAEALDPAHRVYWA